MARSRKILCTETLQTLMLFSSHDVVYFVLFLRLVYAMVGLQDVCLHCTVTEHRQGRDEFDLRRGMARHVSSASLYRRRGQS